MTPKKPRLFLDTSVIIAAVLSPSGGARKLFHLGGAGLMRLVVGPTVLLECQRVVQRKNPTTLPTLAQLLGSGLVETSKAPTSRQVDVARVHVQYVPDAHVLAEAILAKPDWFVTHDKEHFLKHRSRIDLPFEIGTPGDVLQRFKDDLTQP